MRARHAALENGGGADLRRPELAGREQRERVAALRQPAHHQRVLELACERLSDRPDAEAARHGLDRRHAQVHVRREPPVEVQLAQRVGVAQAARREVQEDRPHGLAQLVDALAAQEDVRDVGLDVLDAARRARVGRVGGRRGQRRDEALRQRLHGYFFSSSLPCTSGTKRTPNTVRCSIPCGVRS
jgi:hypothetical protein